jgi:hypothetical protein
MSIVTKQNGVLCEGSGASAFGANLVGDSFNARSKSRLLISGGVLTLPSQSDARHEEGFLLDATASETGVLVGTQVPASAASGASHQKVALSAAVVTQEPSTFGGTTYTSVGLNSVAATEGTVANAAIRGAASLYSVASGTDATAQGLLVGMSNSGSAVTTVNTALSKYGIQAISAGSAKNTAFGYFSRGPIGAASAINASHGLLVDSISVDANAFAVVSGTTPTVVYGVQPSGKVTYSAADVTIATQAATAALTAPAGLITITALTCAAATAVSVSCTAAAGLAVTSASRIALTIQSQTGSAAGLMVVAADSIGANAFSIRIGNTTAATAYGGGAFSVFYRIFN